MADERDPKLTQHYRGLEALEPPAELDRRILAAAREREGAHAPLVVPAGRHRWYYSLAAAAVLVLAVAVTLHVERDRPDPEAAPPVTTSRQGRILEEQKTPAAPPAQDTQAAAKASKPGARPEVFTPDPKPQAQPSPEQAEKPQRDSYKVEPPPPSPAEPSPGARAESPSPVVGRVQQEPRSVEKARPQARVASERAATSDEVRMRAEARNAEQARAEAKEGAARESAALAAAAAAAAKGAPPAAVPAAAPPEKPERWLERIAELRSRGRHAEADKELAEFRKSYPRFPISEVMRERVEGR